MVYFPEDVVECILGYITDHRDRNAVSLVCREWYRVEQLTRYAVLVSNCYAIQPDRVFMRFPKIQSLSVRGKPSLSNPSVLSAGWGASAMPWILAASLACPTLKELQLKRMLVPDHCLMLLLQFSHFNSLSLIGCEGLTTVGLAMVSANCKFLRKLDLQDNKVDDWGAPWLNNLVASCATLETLNFSSLNGAVDPLTLESLVSRCPNLRSLRINIVRSVDSLAKIVMRAPQLVDLGIGSVIFGVDLPYAYKNLVRAMHGCKSLRSFSGYWTSSKFCVLSTYPICGKLTRLNFTYAQKLEEDDFVSLIWQSRRLEELSVMSCVGDKGLHAVATYCKKLRVLKVFHSGMDGKSVTEAGLVSVSIGCPELNSVTYCCSKMTNNALITVAKNSPLLTCFRLYNITPRQPDYVTDQPLDWGFCAIMQSCKNLRCLALCGLLTDQVFLYAGMYAERLEKLVVISAGDSDHGMIYLLNGCRNLRRLEIMDCPFGDTALLTGVGRSGMLQSLWMYSCNVTVGGCKKLAAMVPGLTVEVIGNVNYWNDSAEFPCDDGSSVKKLYAYRSLSGPRNDAPPSVTVLSSAAASE